ncbi:MAG TPA: hypothetical protein VKO18_08220 [Terriglobia bacterium]|nr:hypothetical protein [Terriglobia bacterium]
MGNQQSLLTLNLSGGQRQEIRNGVAGVRVDADGTVTAMATLNCFIDADWFFPALSLQALQTDPTLIISLGGAQRAAKRLRGERMHAGRGDLGFQ